MEKWHTRKSLLLRASDPDNHNAFEEFTEYYQDFIHIVITKLGVSASDSKDLEQDILLKLWKDLAKFDIEHERSNFKGWLSTVIRNEVYQFFRRNRKHTEKLDHIDDADSFIDLSKETSENQLQSMIEEEWKAYVISIALEHIKPFFSGNAMTIFSMTLDGKSVSEISGELEIKENTVYMLRSRVKARFQKEISNIRERLEFPE